MARRVYFSFDYKDVEDFRANVVRNSGRFRGRYNKFHDASIWEEAKQKNKGSLKELIDSGLKGTSVNCVLIGTETYSRDWVKYEICKSVELGKGILGVHINWINDKFGNFKLIPGNNPFEYLRCHITNNGSKIKFFEYTGSFSEPWKPFKLLPTVDNYYFDASFYGKVFKLSKLYKTYSYMLDNGAKNLQEWIEDAAENAGR